VLQSRQLRGKRLRFADNQRRRLAAKAKTKTEKMSRKKLMEIASIIRPDTLLRWYPQKYNGSAKRGPGRPRVRSRTGPGPWRWRCAGTWAACSPARSA
jgi:hypothetical protein